GFGTVEAISLQHRTIDIKKRQDTASVHPEAVFAHLIVPSQVLADALVRIGEYVADNGMTRDGPYQAARDLLMLAGPRVGGQTIKDLEPQRANKKAFVSYATEDEEIAVDLVKYLEDTDCPCWISFRDVDPGEDYRASIVAAIAEVRFLVLVYSAHVNTSFDIATELLLARKRNKRRFVVKVDASEPDGPVEYELAT